MTGEVYKAQGTLYLLIPERGEPVIKKIKCSVKAAAEYQAKTVQFAADQQVNLFVDTSEYKLNDGRQGVSNKLVELDAVAQRQRGSFKIGVSAAPKPEGRVAPSLSVVSNGQQPVGAGR